MALTKVRIQLLDEATGQVLEEVDVLTSPGSVIFEDGKTLADKIDEIQKAQGPKGDTGATGTSLRVKGAWVANTAYVNSAQYIDIVTQGGNTYACKTGHTSSSAFDSANWTLIAQKGATGATGPQGEKGATGATGPQGPKGDIGATGPQGVKGDTGAAGAKGATGATGTSLRVKGAWAANTAYVNNSQYIDIVTQGGNTYACKTGHTSSTTFDSTNWTLIAQRGAAGATGPQGAKGDTGATGPQGPKGDTGATGAKGATGATGPAGKDGDSVKFGTAYNTATEVKLFLEKM